MLERLFTSKVRINLLAQFIMHPDARYHVRGLERAIGSQYSAVWRELQNLEQAGVVVSEEDAGRRMFRLNEDYPLLAELRGMIIKTLGAGDRIRDLIGEIDGIQFAFIYGSFADGQVDAYSDLDLMIIGDADFTKLSGAIADLETELRRTVNVVRFSFQEWRSKLEAEDAFVSEVFRSPKIMLMGSEDDL